MRYHGRARVSTHNPEAWAICGRCGKLYNHVDLGFQFDWQGPRLQNLRVLVCDGCLDKPFEHNRTIILPPDPMPILNPRPEFYISDDNPISPLGWDALSLVSRSSQVFSGNLGNMTLGVGIDAPFRGALNKPKILSALASPSNSSANYVGKNWSTFNMAQSQIPSLPNVGINGSGLPAIPGVAYALTSVTIQAPIDAAFIGSSKASMEIDGWTSSAWASLWTGMSAGLINETLTITFNSPVQCYGHRVVIYGDGVHDAAIASIQFEAAGRGVYTTAPPLQPS